MRPRSVRGRWRTAVVAAVVASVVALAVGGLAGCTAGPAPSDPGSPNRPTIGPGGTVVRVLQMNLCNSGRAGCYSGGRAISMAAALISQNRPDMVTLNEICRGDVDLLKRSMSAAFHGAAVASAFRAAQGRPTQAPVRCQNGSEFGDGVLAVLPSGAGRFRTYSGVYPVQDRNDVEERVWVCIDPASQLSGCTTHAASTSTAVALAQCRYLLSSAVQRGRHHRDGPIVVAGDLNIAAAGSPSPQSCVPPGYQRTDDGALQDVVVSPGVSIRSHYVIDMRGATDHPGLLVDLVLSHR